MSTSEKPHVSLGTLRRHLRGVPVTGPGEEGWHLARQAFNADDRPAPGAGRGAAPHRRRRRRRSLRGRRAASRSRPSAPATTPGRLAISATRLLETDQLRGDDLDVEGRRARVRSGANWEDVVPAASELGLAALHGSTPDVSIAGYSLGGGMGWYARKHGLAANSVTAIELVTAEASCSASTPSTSPTSSGRCAAAAATSASSRRSSSISSRSPRSTPASSSSRTSARARCCTPGTSGCRPCPRRSPRSAACCSSRRSRTCPTPRRGKSFVVVEAAFLGSEADGTS